MCTPGFSKSFSNQTVSYHHETENSKHFHENQTIFYFSQKSLLFPKNHRGVLQEKTCDIMLYQIKC